MNSFLENFNEENTSGITTEGNELEEDATYLEKQKKKKIITIVVTIILVISIGTFTTLSKLVEVPNFVDGLNTIATKWGKTNNIEITEKQTYDNKIAEGMVISQSVKSGKKIFKGKSLSIIVSKGKDPNEKIKVPDLKTITVAEIKTWKQENDLENVTIKEEYSDKIESGNIITYEFDSALTNENNFTRSDKLTIIISKGKKQLTMEDFSNKTKEDASKWCTENGVKCSFKETYDKTVANNNVISQSIKKDTVVDNGSKIVFTISLGEGITIPNYNNTSSEDASNLNDKVKVKVRYVYDMKISYGKLISQSIKAGKVVKSDESDVTLTYSLGIPYFSSLIGTSESEISKVFYEYNQKGVNFSYSIKYVDSDEEKGKIVWTSKSNEFVTINENIEIHVSKGK